MVTSDYLRLRRIRRVKGRVRPGRVLGYDSMMGYLGIDAHKEYLHVTVLNDTIDQADNFHVPSTASGKQELTNRLHPPM